MTRADPSYRLFVALLCASAMAGVSALLPLAAGVPGAVLQMALVACAGGVGALIGAARRRSISAQTGLEALANSEAYLAEIAARTTNAIAITDEQRRIEWINPAFERMYGYRLDDLRGRTLPEAFAAREQDQPVVERVVAAMVQGRSVAGEVAYRHRGGHELATRMELTSLRDAAGEIIGYMGVHEDVTEQRRAERELQASETRFRLLTEVAPIMAWVEDEEGACQWIGEQWINFVGCGTAPDRGEAWLDYVHADDRERTRELSRAAGAARAPFEARYRLRRHDGVYRHVLDRGVPRWDEAGGFLGYVGAVTDISQLEEQQRETAEMRNYLIDAIESIDGGVVILDAQDRIVLCNRRYQKMFDLPDSMVEPGTTYRQPLLEFYRAHPEFCDGRTPEQALAERMRMHRSEAIWERRFGERWVQVRERATPTGGLVSLRMDITAAKRAEIALRERQEFLELAVRASRDGLWDLDTPTGTLQVSPRLKALLGYRDEEIDSDWSRWRSFIHPDDAAAFDAAFGRVVTDAEEFELEYRVRMKSGEWRWFRSRAMAIRDESGVTCRVTGWTADINEGKLREQEATRMHRLLDEAIEAMGAGIACFDAEERLVFCNERYREIYGVPSTLGVPGTRFRDLLKDFFTRHPEYRERLALEDVVKYWLSRHHHAGSVREQKLGDRWLLVNECPTADGGVVSLHTDITALKRLEADRSLANSPRNARPRQAQR